VTIIIYHVNNNPPTFLPAGTWHISESSLPGSIVARVALIRNDFLPDTVIFYSILYTTNESMYFEITNENQQTGLITLKRPLNCTGIGGANLTVMAIDGSNKLLNSSTTLTIVIEDTCGDVPVWTQFEYVIYVFENATLGTSLTRVAAVSRCPNLLGYIIYSLTDTSSSVAQTFYMNNKTVRVQILWH